MNNIFDRFRGGCLTIVGVVALICAAAIFLPRLIGNTEPAYNPGDYENNAPTSNEPRDTFPAQSSSRAQLGAIVSSTSIDRDGCPVDSVQTFDNNEAIYVVATNSTIDEGTEIFARMYYENQAIEDAEPIVAQQDYNNTCVNFVFESANLSGFDSGDYEVEFIVNGNPSNTIRFRVQ